MRAVSGRGTCIAPRDVTDAGINIVRLDHMLLGRTRRKVRCRNRARMIESEHDMIEAVLGMDLIVGNGERARAIARARRAKLVETNLFNVADIGVGRVQAELTRAAADGCVGSAIEIKTLEIDEMAAAAIDFLDRHDDRAGSGGNETGRRVIGSLKAAGQRYRRSIRFGAVGIIALPQYIGLAGA